MAITKASGNAVSPAAKGDLVVGSATNDAAVLGVGTNDQVLTADSSTATGLKWAAVAAGAGNMAQIATGTLSGASVVVSGLSSYTDLVVFVYGFTNNTGAGNFYLRINATATDHDSRGWYNNSTGWDPYGFVNTTDFSLTGEQYVTRTDSNNISVIKLTNCKNPGFTDAEWTTAWQLGFTNARAGLAARGVYTKNETVSSITLRNSGGTWAGGTYTVWGA
jgi:hypothetical protein